jgi:hypothetical protein
MIKRGGLDDRKLVIDKARYIKCATKGLHLADGRALYSSVIA